MSSAVPATMLDRLGFLARDIKLSHSVFALPFAVLGMFMAAASVDALPTAVQLLLIVLCMFFARTVAMLVNRWADAGLDAANPRTASRAIPSGQLSRPFVLGATIVCAACFVATASGFWWIDGNVWPLVLSPLVLAWLGLYSYMKRFTWLCHLFLGSALALSPIAAAIAIEPSFLTEPDVYLLALMVMCWVAGFDVIYALQDVEADRELGLYSMPSRLGVGPALAVSRGLHALSIAALALLWRSSDALAAGFAVGVAACAALLIFEHALVWRSRTNHLNMAFFTVNGVISVLLGGLGLVDIVLAVR